MVLDRREEFIRIAISFAGEQTLDLGSAMGVDLQVLRPGKRRPIFCAGFEYGDTCWHACGDSQTVRRRYLYLAVEELVYRDVSLGH